MQQLFSILKILNFKKIRIRAQRPKKHQYQLP